MTNIRKMMKKDMKRVEMICLATADEHCNSSHKMRENTLNMYCRYYTRAEIENCFVLTDENDNAVGYVLCAIDYDKYKKDFIKHELKAIRKIDLGRAISARFEVALQKRYKGKYNAHLHIDILKEYQGCGGGTRLISALLSNLKGKNINGVMLTVGKENKIAIAFYKKQGFKVIKNLGGAIVMGNSTDKHTFS
ncbi:MAG: GNAT family N-acetyltransferase [Oscillospiraceae bacterium]